MSLVFMVVTDPNDRLTVRNRHPTIPAAHDWVEKAPDLIPVATPIAARRISLLAKRVGEALLRWLGTVTMIRVCKKSRLREKNWDG